jgi:hypothetical protein
MLKHVLNLLLSFFSFITTGCVHGSLISPQETTTLNFREKIKIKAITNKLSKGSRIDRMKNCFPPATNRVCGYKVKDVYKIDEPLNMEVFDIHLDLTDDLNRIKSNELMYLTAAELSIQRGFDYLIIYNNWESTDCIPHSTSVTRKGHYNNITGEYFDNAEIKDNSDCVVAGGFTVLLFNEYRDVKNGVFYKNEYSDKILPLDGLYLSNDEIMQKIIDGNKYAMTMPPDAWKNFYSAKELASELAKKYRTSLFTSYKIERVSFPNKSLLDSLKKGEEHGVQ